MAANKKVSRTSSMTAINQAAINQAVVNQPASQSGSRQVKSSKPVSASQPVNHSVSSVSSVVVQPSGALDAIDSSQASRPCELCRTHITDDQLTSTVLQCCLCDLLFHGICCQIEDTLMEFIHVVNDIGGWCCKSCRTTKRTKITKTTKLTQKNADNIDAIHLQMTKISDQISNLSIGFDKLVSIIPNTGTLPIKPTSSLVAPVLSKPPGVIKGSYAEVVKSAAEARHPTTSGLDKKLQTAVLSAVHEEFSSISQRSLNVVVSGLPVKTSRRMQLFSKSYASPCWTSPHM